MEARAHGCNPHNGPIRATLYHHEQSTKEVTDSGPRPPWSWASSSARGYSSRRTTCLKPRRAACPPPSLRLAHRRRDHGRHGLRLFQDRHPDSEDQRGGGLFRTGLRRLRGLPGGMVHDLYLLPHPGGRPGLGLGQLHPGPARHAGRPVAHGMGVSDRLFPAQLFLPGPGRAVAGDLHRGQTHSFGIGRRGRGPSPDSATA